MQDCLFMAGASNPTLHGFSSVCVSCFVCNFWACRSQHAKEGSCVVVLQLTLSPWTTVLLHCSPVCVELSHALSIDGRASWGCECGELLSRESCFGNPSHLLSRVAFLYRSRYSAYLENSVPSTRKTSSLILSTPKNV